MTKNELQNIINEMIEAQISDINLYYEGWLNFGKTTLPEDCIEEHYNILNEKIDLDEGYGKKLRPVYVILLYSDSSFDKFVEKFVKGQSYWHASMAFGPALSQCYSFNFGEASANKFKGGLSFESLSMYKEEHPNARMEVNCILLNSDKYKEIKKSINYYLQNKEKTKYSFINLIYSWLGHKTKDGLRTDLVCSTFVDTILKSINVNISGKTSNLVKPDDLKAKSSKKQFKLFEGDIKNYAPEKIAKETNRLANDISNDYFYKKK